MSVVLNEQICMHCKHFSAVDNQEGTGKDVCVNYVPNHRRYALWCKGYESSLSSGVALSLNGHNGYVAPDSSSLDFVEAMADIQTWENTLHAPKDKPKIDPAQLTAMEFDWAEAMADAFIASQAKGCNAG